MLYAKLVYLYQGWPNVCQDNDKDKDSKKKRFKQKLSTSNQTKKTDKDITEAQRDKMKLGIDDLWNTIDQQCKGMEIGVEQCQSKIFSDALINSKMADLVEKVPKAANSSATDLHQINMKIIDDIQASLNEPGLSSEELKKRVYEVSKLLPFNHPANETLDSVKDFLTIQEAQEEKMKNKE